MLRLLIFTTLLIFRGRLVLGERCENLCSVQYHNEKESNFCREGCRLVAILNLAFTDEAKSIVECHDGCKKSFLNDEEKNPCIFGCNNQKLDNNGKIEISITDNQPTYRVASQAINEVLSRIFAPLSSFRSPFEQINADIQSEIGNFRKLAQRLLNRKILDEIGYHQFHDMKSDKTSRQNSNESDSNNGSFDRSSGAVIVKTMPASVSLSANSVDFFKDFNKKHKDSSWLSLLSMRTHHISVIGQWMICASLWLFLILMLILAIIIVQKIKSKKYRNLRNAVVVMPFTFGSNNSRGSHNNWYNRTNGLLDSLTTKKVPLEKDSTSTAAAVMNDYIQSPPLSMIRNSPPPAYDQLSVHKEKQSGNSDDNEKEM